MSNVSIFPTRATRSAYDDLIRDEATTLTAAVAAIADGHRTDLIADDDRSRLVIALTLLAAGLPLPLVATSGSALRDTLDRLDDGNGPEFFLLHHGLTVEQFHALRERLDETGVSRPGSAA